MQELKRTQLTVQQERALLVSVILPKSQFDPLDPLEELRALAKTAGANVVDEMVAKRQKVHAGLYVGTGKAEEIAARAEMNHVSAVIFDNDLSPGQIRDLEKVINRKVLDRSELILDIFAGAARSAEAKLQVELAQLEYTYPRLQHMWTHLERMAGGAATAASAVGGIGTRGPGEKQLEIDRRLVQKRVSDLKRRIAEVDARKRRLVRSRRDFLTTCLVGYTNAGKSSLMNLFTDAGAYVADKLFATLDTRTRRWNLGEGNAALLSDTVGFISHLPHHLVASFRATLEEAIGADLLLHVADASHPLVDQQIKAVETVLKDLGCAEKDQVLLLNKVDALTDPAVRTLLVRKYPGAILLSAKTGENAEAAVAEVLRRVRGAEVTVGIQASVANGPLLNYLAQFARVSLRTYSDDGSTVQITATIGANQAANLRSFGPDVKVRDL